MAQNDKQQLVHWLDQHAFDPILRKSPDDFSGKDRQKFEHVHKATQSEKERFHGYDSAEKVRQMFLDDLSSSAAKSVNRDLDDLGLPKLPDLKDDFLRLCERLGVQ